MYIGPLEHWDYGAGAQSAGPLEDGPFVLYSLSLHPLQWKQSSKNNEDDLTCDHEEADTRIVCHISKVPEHSNILIIASDTDILIILLGNATPLEVENIILGDSQDDSADNEEDSDVCSDEVDSSDDSESSLESDYE
ncbi:hypothetical protein EVAR_11088_1 [Eumeta japonica]|uniref:Uncharacterized protein n=1 Tax=Eumeta variegata TaxID=151549 RepID=A0A4C1U4K8_EUMVA|nr:hypothetical protein EVAR_11088_1 [Eumeta japonica]